MAEMTGALVGAVATVLEAADALVGAEDLLFILDG